MSWDWNARTLPRDASGDLSGSQYLAGVIDASGEVAVAGAAANADGVIYDNNAKAQGEAVAFGTAHGSVYIMTSGAAFAAGAELATDAAGKVVAASASNPIIGKAMEAASGADERVPVLFGFRGTA